MAELGRLRSVVPCAAWLVLLIGVMPAAASASAGAKGWTRSDLRAVSQPAPVGDAFVLYAHRRGSLEVVALDARDGSTKWTANATPSNVTAGVPAELAIRDDSVFYLAKAAGPIGTAAVVARDAGSGRIVWRSAAGAFLTWPAICPDDPVAICVNGVVPNVGWGELRYAAADGRLLAVVQIGTPDNPGRELAPDLIDPGPRAPEDILATSGGRVAWRHPLSEIFTLPRASSDGGWDFDRVPDRNLFVGSVGTTPKIVNGRGTVNLAVSMTAGFALADGHVAWRSPGFYSCGQPLPCPGRAETGYTSPAGAPEPSTGLRLVERGTASFSVQGGAPKVSRNAGVTIQGFDLSTGKTTWSFDAGRSTQLISGEFVPARIDESTIVVDNRSGRPVALDLRTGATRGVPAGARAWCQQSIQYHLSGGAYYQGKSGLYAGQGGLYPCTIGGRRAAMPPTIPAFVGRIGATADGVTAWTDANAVHAAPS